jgi:hypothetical protein
MAGKEDLKLLGLPLSPFVISVRMALNMKRSESLRVRRRGPIQQE